MCLDAAGHQREDKQSPSGGAHPPAAVDLQNGRGGGEIASFQRGEEIVLPVGRRPADPSSSCCEWIALLPANGRFVTPTKLSVATTSVNYTVLRGQGGEERAKLLQLYKTHR